MELDKLSLKVFKHDNLILKEYRNLSDGLWNIPIVAPMTHPGLYSNRMKYQSPNIPSSTKPKRQPKLHHKKPKELTLNKIDSYIKEVDNQQANVIIRKQQSKADLA